MQSAKAVEDVALYAVQLFQVPADLVRLADRCSPPQLLEPCRVGGRVLDGVLNIAMSEVILNEPRISALVGQGEAASVAQHVASTRSTDSPNTSRNAAE